MDLYSRKIIGWAYDTNMSAELALKAVKNACIESFHSLIKKEEIYRRVYKDSKEAYDSIFEYIESWYNCQRTHSSLGYKTPAAVHAECAA